MRHAALQCIATRLAYRQLSATIRGTSRLEILRECAPKGCVQSGMGDRLEVTCEPHGKRERGGGWGVGLGRGFDFDAPPLVHDNRQDV